MAALKILRKHVAIIHAYSMMSTLQRKIANVLFYEAINNKTDSDNQNSVSVETTMAFSKLARVVNFNSNNNQYLKEAIDGLASLTIEWNLLKDKSTFGIFIDGRLGFISPTSFTLTIS